MSRKLVVFDVDGTLVDSQAEILAAMGTAFSGAGLGAPAREDILGIVGLSLPQAMAQLVPDAPQATQTALADGYKSAFSTARLAGATGPLYPGMRAVLERLALRENVLMGVATGKSRRGLTGLVEHHDLTRFFATLQCADDHPSKPHPSMLQAALSEAGVAAGDAVMIGDTCFDIDMGRAAGVATIGVTWGYHPRSVLGPASRIAERAEDLDAAIEFALGGVW